MAQTARQSLRSRAVQSVTPSTNPSCADSRIASACDKINKDYVARLGSNGASPASPVAEPLTCRLIANRSWAALVDRRLALST